MDTWITSTFWLLWIMLQWIFSYKDLFKSFWEWYVLRKEIAKSFGDTVFNFLRNCQNAFNSSCAILHSHQQCKRFPGSPYSQPKHYFPFKKIIIFSFLVGVNGISLRVLSCLFGCTGSLLLCRVPLAAESRGSSLVVVPGLLMWWLLSLWCAGSGHTCSVLVAQDQALQHAGFGIRALRLSSYDTRA